MRKPLSLAYTLLIGVLVILTITLIYQRETSSEAAEVVREAGVKLKEMASKLEERLSFIVQLNDEELPSYFTAIEDGKSFSFYLLEDDRVRYWSDSEPAISDSLLLQTDAPELLRLPNGDFLSNTKTLGSRKVVGLLLIRHRYELENSYLSNLFNPELGIDDGFSESAGGDTLHIPGLGEYYLLRHSPIPHVPGVAFMTAMFLSWLLALIAIFLLLRHFSKSLPRVLGIVFLVVAVRLCMMGLKVPHVLFDHPIFSPTFYASSFYFNSLGDMLFNASLFLVFAIAFYVASSRTNRNRIVYYFGWAATAFLIHYLIRGLIINSRLSFELSRPGDINAYSILAFVSITMLLLCFLFITAGVLRRLMGYEIKGRHALLAITACAAYTTIALSMLNRQKEQETRKLFAQKADMRQDQIAEYIIRQQEASIASDIQVTYIIESGLNTSELLNQYLAENYFNGYLSRYEVQSRILQRGSVGLADLERQAATGKSTISRNLVYIDSETGGSYLSVLPLADSTNYLAISLTTRFLKSAQGFPELLKSDNFSSDIPQEDYSIARYDKGSLVYEFGEYIYPLTSKIFPGGNGEYAFVIIGNYDHLLYRTGKDSFIVVSRPRPTIFGVLTLFSWMFAFLNAGAFAVLFISLMLFGKWQLNLTRRVQVSVIFLIVFTFLMVGFGTVRYINTKYQTDQRRSISDQVNALWFAVNEKLNYSATPSQLPNQRTLMDDIVRSTNIDFNIFDRQGRLFYSSQPGLFDRGIISPRMNPEAYFTIRDEGLTQFIHPEKAGRLRYIAAYAPFTDQAGNISAYLNLPYFEKQNELNRDVSVFLSALVNIYVLLFAIAVLVTIFISSRITKPLLLIRESMSGIRLGAKNKKINYEVKDEIGQLVSEYNRMIDELAISANMLARSERESAWREMARQVAHEIKNPLTPMKLSVQHLYRTFREEHRDDQGQVKRITNTLLQQIDTLSNIATAFSNFAQMPQPVPERIELNELLNQISSLYAEGVEITVEGEKSYVLADKDRMNGVFTNLVKNAVQSIPPERPGRITVRLSRKPLEVIVEITDNGIGIPEDQRDKIFIPNFTTKTSGMGLGLAIVRKIVEEATGKIWFTSIYGEGSSFFVSLPATE